MPEKEPGGQRAKEDTWPKWQGYIEMRNGELGGACELEKFRIEGG